MTTEQLNEYIFAKLVIEEARVRRRARQRTMESSGISHEEVVSTPLTEGDIREGLKDLEWYRVQSLKALQESLSESAK